MTSVAIFFIVAFIYSVGFVLGFIIKETTTIIGILLALLLSMLSMEYLSKRKRKTSIKI